MATKKSRDYVAFPLEKVNGILPELHQADIVLIHIKRDFLRYFLRKVTKSYWDHAALVLFTKDLKKGRYYDQILEAVKPNGVEIHKLEKYLKDPNKYDIGIKRMPKLDLVTSKRIISFMLMNVDAPYYKLSRIKFFLASISKRFRKWFLARQRYSGTGLVQKTFYEAAHWEEKEKFVFKTDNSLSPIELQELTTAADIANNTYCQWIYNQK